MTKEPPKEEKKIYNHRGYSNPLDEVARSFAEKTNKTMKTSISIFLVVATFFVCLQVQDHEFIDYDDKALISQNWNIKSGKSKESVVWAFTTT